MKREMQMHKPKLVPTERCCVEMACEAQLGWEAAAYLALEAMQDGRFRARRPSTLPRSRR
jgi:hypothetical protein